MAYYDERLQEFQRRVSRKKRLEAELAELDAQRHTLSQRVEMLEERKLEEQKDVDRLEGRSLAAFFYNVIGKRDEKLDQERREAYDAAVRYDVALRELTAVETDIRHGENELAALQNCEEEYAKLLAAKADAIKQAGVAEAAEILALEEGIARLGSQLQETGEAISAGDLALSTVDEVMKNLNSAEEWGNLDLLLDGFMFDAIKYDHLDKAQEQVEQLQGQLRRFKTELSDVEMDADLRVGIDDFLRFSDYFFDNLFTDWAVLDQINRSQAQVEQTWQQVSGVLTRLENRQQSLQKEQAALRAKLEKLVLSTVVSASGGVLCERN